MMTLGRNVTSWEISRHTLVLYEATTGSLIFQRGEIRVWVWVYRFGGYTLLR